MTPVPPGSGKEVMLTVIGEEIYGDGHKDSTRTCCRAVCEKTFDGSGGPDSAVYTFRYREEAPGSSAAAESVMKFSGGGCVIVRSGEICARMQFEPGKEHRFMYGTPYGDIPMTIRTRLVASREVGDNFHARIRYTLAPEGSEPAECAVTVRAEPVRD